LEKKIPLKRHTIWDGGSIVFTILSFKKESWFMFSTCYLLLIEEKNVE